MGSRDFLKLLPDIFDRRKESNVGKLFDLVSEQFELVSSLLNQIEQWRGIDDAKGTTLDQLGANVGQYRGKTNDELYRILIRGKLLRNYSDGTTNRILRALSYSLSCPPSDIQLVYAHETADEKEPAAIIIKKAPLTYLNKSGLTVAQFMQIVESITAGGVRVSYVNLEGTFSFASGKTVEISDEGFADIEGTIGGELGGVFLPSDDYELPL